MSASPEACFYKKIKLYAGWIHKQHSWNYISDEYTKNIIKAYCSEKDCEYYATSKDTTKNCAVLEVGLKGNETNNIIYSGNSVEAEIKTNTFTNAAVSEITYKQIDKYTGEASECGTPVAAGKYRAEVTIGDDNNHATASIEYEIEKALIDKFNVSLEGGGFQYGSPAIIQLSGKPENIDVTYQYKVKDSTDSEYQDINEEELKTLPVGEYTLKATVRESVNYESTSATCDFKITKADISSENSTVHTSDWVYGFYNEAENGPSVDKFTNPGNGNVSYIYYTDAAYESPTTSANSGASVDGGRPENVGTYYVKAEIPATDNYNSTTATGSFKIIPRPVKLKWSASEFIYDGEEKSVYATVENALDGDTFELVYENAKGRNAQTYVAKVTELGNSNYSLEEKDGKPIETISHSWEIKKATPQIILPEKTLTYTGKAADYSFSGVTLAGDESYNQETHGEIKYSYHTVGNNENFTNGLPVHAGTYEVQATLAESENYNGTSVTAKLVIEPKTVTVTADSFSKHIGENDPKIFTYQVEGLIDGDYLNGIEVKRDKGEDAGEYKITVTETPDINLDYKVILKEGKFTITDHIWDIKVLVPATAWSVGKQENTCTVEGCGETRYYTIPKTGESEDPYADVIDKHAKVKSGNIKGATLNNNETQFLEVPGIFEPDEIVEIKKKTIQAKVWIEITAIAAGQETFDFIKKEAEKIAGTNAPVNIFNIALQSQVTGKDSKEITNPGSKMNISLEIPDEMVNKRPYTIRNYKVLRMHTDTTTKQDTIDVIDAAFNSNTNEITFETDRFSIYAITYKDTYYSPSYPVTGIKVSPDTLTLTKKDETAQLTAEVTPSYADNKRVTWKSSDEKVATVDENGKVTAVSNGTATITATSVSGNYTATVSVTVKIPVEIEKITIETETETLTKIGESTDLKVKIEPENADPQKMTWKSSDEKVVIVDENGKVTAAANGTATITVTTEDGKHTASVTITVNIPDEPVISNTTGFGRLKARSTKQTKTSVTLEWSRIDDTDGYFIYGSRCNTSTKSYKYKKLATITNGNTRTWTQKGLKKATYYKYVVKAYKIVNGKKVVTDTSASIHTVTQGGKYGVAKSVSVTKIGNKKNVTKLTLKKGKTAQITAKEIKKDNKIKQHRNLCYESSNTKVATVTSKGLIRAVGKGTCTIWAYAQNGVYKALTITVK